MVREIPLSVLFTWPQPNYVDPVTRGPALIIINIIFVSLCTILLFLRLYTRIFVKRWFGSDDVFIILAYMSTVGLTVNVIIANKHYYWDRHVWDVPITAFTGVLKVAFSAKLIFVYASTFTRQSLLCFYYRLVADSGIKWFGWALHATVFLNVAAVITFTCLGIWQCNPISAYWTLSPPAGAYCLDEGKTVLGIGIVNCFIDLLVTVLPIPLVRKLQMPLQQRIGIIILLSMGLLVVVAGVVRTYYIWKGLIASYDETWYTFPLWIAAAVEINLGVICACMPALRPFIKRCVAPAFSSVSSRISSLISGNSTTPDTSTVQNSRHSRGNGSYQKFRNSKPKAIDPTSNSSADSSTLKETGKTHITHHHHTTSIDADADNHDHHHHDNHHHDNHDDDDEVSFLPHPHARDIAYNVTPRLPPPPPRSPLQITYRQSFELVSLDRREERRDGLASPPRSPRRQRQQEREQQLDLDPRGRLEGSAAFGCQTRVSSRHGVSGDEEEVEERYDDDVEGGGGAGGRRRSGFLGLPGLGVGRGWGRR